MTWWKTKKRQEEDTSVSEVQRLAEEQRALQDGERVFWDWVIYYSNPENEIEAERMVRVADFMLKARRERFPQ